MRWHPKSQEYKKFHQEYSPMTTDMTDKEENKKMSFVCHVTIWLSTDWWRVISGKL